MKPIKATTIRSCTNQILPSLNKKSSKHQSYYTRAIDANISCRSNMRASMRLAHNSDNGDTTGSSDWLDFQDRNECVLVFIRDGRDNIDDLRSA
jgi:hypothetical protein